MKRGVLQCTANSDPDNRWLPTLALEIRTYVFVAHHAEQGRSTHTVLVEMDDRQDPSLRPRALGQQRSRCGRRFTFAIANDWDDNSARSTQRQPLCEREYTAEPPP